MVVVITRFLNEAWQPVEERVVDEFGEEEAQRIFNYSLFTSERISIVRLRLNESYVFSCTGMARARKKLMGFS